jgi:hypothetical protein
MQCYLQRITFCLRCFGVGGLVRCCLLRGRFGSRSVWGSLRIGSQSCREANEYMTSSYFNSVVGFNEYRFYRDLRHR